MKNNLPWMVVAGLIGISLGIYLPNRKIARILSSIIRNIR